MPTLPSRYAFLGLRIKTPELFRRLELETQQRHSSSAELQSMKFQVLIDSNTTLTSISNGLIYCSCWHIQDFFLQRAAGACALEWSTCLVFKSLV
ncbi:hypothetical protein ACU8KH_03785 [Lachancea thermotolerans]